MSPSYDGGKRVMYSAWWLHSALLSMLWVSVSGWLHGTEAQESDSAAALSLGTRDGEPNLALCAPRLYQITRRQARATKITFSCSAYEEQRKVILCAFLPRLFFHFAQYFSTTCDSKHHLSKMFTVATFCTHHLNTHNALLLFIITTLMYFVFSEF